jgi:hypothetical protein
MRQLRQGRDVAVHAEHAVSDEQPGLLGRGPEQLRGLREIAVAVAPDFGADRRQPSINDA